MADDNKNTSEQTSATLSRQENRLLANLEKSQTAYLKELEKIKPAEVKDYASVINIFSGKPQGGYHTKALESLLLTGAPQYVGARKEYTRAISTALHAIEDERNGVFTNIALLTAGIGASAAIEIAALTELLKQQAIINNPVATVSTLDFIIPASISLLGAKAYMDGHKGLAYGMAALVAGYFLAQNTEAASALASMMSNSDVYFQKVVSYLSQLGTAATPTAPVSGLPPLDGGIPPMPGIEGGFSPPPVPGLPDASPPSPAISAPPLPTAPAAPSGPVNFDSIPGLIAPNATQTNDLLRVLANGAMYTLVPPITIVVVGKLMQEWAAQSALLTDVSHVSDADKNAGDTVANWRKKTGMVGTALKTIGLGMAFATVATVIAAPSYALGLTLATVGVVTAGMLAGSFNKIAKKKHSRPTIKDQRRTILAHLSAPTFGASNGTGVISAEAIVHNNVLALRSALSQKNLSDEANTAVSIAIDNALKEARRLDKSVNETIDALGQSLEDASRVNLSAKSKGVVATWIDARRERAEAGRLVAEAEKQTQLAALHTASVAARTAKISADEQVAIAEVEAAARIAAAQAAAANGTVTPIAPANANVAAAAGGTTRPAAKIT